MPDRLPLLKSFACGSTAALSSYRVYSPTLRKMSESEVLSLKMSLDKQMVVDSGIQLDSSVLESTLKSLEEVSMTMSLLKSTLIGKSVANVAKKFGDGPLGGLAKRIIGNWKVITAAAKKEKELANDVGEKRKLTSIDAKVADVGASNAKHIKILQEGYEKPVSKTILDNDPILNQKPSSDEYSDLPDHRRKTMKLMSNRIKDSVPDESIADFLGFQIEKSIMKMHNYDLRKDEYIAKARSLAFNLKNNEHLRSSIVDGTLPAEAIVYLSQEELATQEQKDSRAKDVADASMERRADYFKVARDKLCRDNGIDPNAGGEFTCGKCKSTKTSHYQMQTRSADEPMTVFISCLKCGNRWKE